MTLFPLKINQKTMLAFNQMNLQKNEAYMCAAESKLVPKSCHVILDMLIDTFVTQRFVIQRKFLMKD